MEAATGEGAERDAFTILGSMIYRRAFPFLPLVSSSGLFMEALSSLFALKPYHLCSAIQFLQKLFSG